MSDIILPTEAEVRAIDTNSFTWHELLDGLLSEDMGAVIKSIADQMDPGETINIVEAFCGTGKTAKFIAENTTNGSSINIVTTDTFTDMFLNTSDYFDNTGGSDNPNIYQNDISGMVETVFDEGGNPIAVRTYDLWGADPSVILDEMSLTEPPELLHTRAITELKWPRPPSSHIVNYNGDALQTETFLPKVNVYIPWPVSLAAPEFEQRNMLRTLVNLYDMLPVGGVLIIPGFFNQKVNEVFWQAFNALTAVGKSWSYEWLQNTESDLSGSWQAAVIKKI